MRTVKTFLRVSIYLTSLYLLNMKTRHSFSALIKSKQHNIEHTNLKNLNEIAWNSVLDQKNYNLKAYL